MKPLFIFCCLLFTLQSKAVNDTLTRAQVYNFNVGDTFDYQDHDYGSDDYPEVHSWDNYSYYRTIIIGKFYSQNLDTLFYTQKILGLSGNALYNDSVQYETLVIPDQIMYAAFYDYDNAISHADTPRLSDSIDNTTPFNGRLVNKLGLGGFEQGETITFAEGLGEVYNHSEAGDHSSSQEDAITVLIYYSQNGQTWGTPYNIAVSVPNIPQQNSSITLFPTINNGQFKLSITDANNPSPQLIIYDLTGREVKRTNVTSGTNDIALDNASPGMYLWSVTSQGTILKSGKLIIQ